MKNNNTSNSSFSGVDLGKSSGPSSSRLKQANHSGLTPKASGSATNHRGNLGSGKSKRAPDGLGPVIGGTVKPKNCGC